jgi:hypothetical protein
MACIGVTSWFDLEARVAFRLAKRSWDDVARFRVRREGEIGTGEATWEGMVLRGDKVWGRRERSA